MIALFVFGYVCVALLVACAVSPSVVKDISCGIPEGADYVFAAFFSLIIGALWPLAGLVCFVGMFAYRATHSQNERVK